MLKVAFVDKDAISVFTYRLCPECGVSMDQEESADETVWTCGICGCEVRGSESPPSETGTRTPACGRLT